MGESKGERMNSERLCKPCAGCSAQEWVTGINRRKSRREEECVLLSGRLPSCDGVLVREKRRVREEGREGGETERAVDLQRFSNCWLQATTSLKSHSKCVCVCIQYGVSGHCCQKATFLFFSLSVCLIWLIYDKNVCMRSKENSVRICLSFYHWAAILNIILWCRLYAAKHVTKRKASRGKETRRLMNLDRSRL